MEGHMKPDERNLTLLTDFYELTMMQGYFREEEQNVQVIFDAFFRNNPDGNAFSISCGLEQVIQLAHKLNISTVVEGVETLQDHDLIRKLHCDFGQGYYYRRPISEEEFYDIYLKEK